MPRVVLVTEEHFKNQPSEFLDRGIRYNATIKAIKEEFGDHVNIYPYAFTQRFVIRLANDVGGFAEAPYEVDGSLNPFQLVFAGVPARITVHG